jgi:hypothetical protein
MIESVSCGAGCQVAIRGNVKHCQIDDSVSVGNRPFAGQGYRDQPVRHGLSIEPGGSAREIDISGGIKTHGAGVAPIEQHGSIETFRVDGGFVAVAGGFDKI